jgi:hypothetical protein
MQNDLVFAINHRLIIEFNFGGKRQVEPHVLGLYNGRLQLLSYQLSGASVRGGLPDWRRFDVNELSSLLFTSQVFAGSRPNPSGKHAVFDKKIAVVGRLVVENQEY